MLRTAVIGVGHLGRFHAQKYAAMSDVKLIGVADINSERAKVEAGKLGTAWYTDYKQLLGSVDAVSVVTPTRDHFQVACDCLEAGVNILVEKPIARSLREAESLIELADRRGLVLQVGHLERFNPAFVASQPYRSDPLFIEANRISPFSERGTDVDVVLDLMIHDIDIALYLVGKEPEWIHAAGLPVVTPSIDIANVRLEFDTGCVANLTASRISAKSERKARIFQRDSYLAIDFGKGEVNVSRRILQNEFGAPFFETKALPISVGDALENEIRSFLDSVRSGNAPVVGGSDGLRALSVALRINEDIKSRQEKFFGSPCILTA